MTVKIRLFLEKNEVIFYWRVTDVNIFNESQVTEVTCSIFLLVILLFLSSLDLVFVFPCTCMLFAGQASIPPIINGKVNIPCFSRWISFFIVLIV